MTFHPRFSYDPELIASLLEVEAAKAVIEVLPLPPDRALRLRLDALQKSTHSSTQIEGNPLDIAAVRRAIAAGPRVGTQAEQEVRNYWRALHRVEEFCLTTEPITEAFIRELHAVVIVRGRGRRGAESEYRVGECPVVDTATRRIDYGPPEPKDVPGLMGSLVQWLGSPAAARIPAAIRAGIAVHRFLSVHPFPDGNGRTGRLLGTAVLWQSSYRMRNFLSFDEYFNADRSRYYQNLQMSLPVDYYQGRHDPDHTPWLRYFVGVLACAAGQLRERARRLYEGTGRAAVPWETLNRPQQQVLTEMLAREQAVETGAAELRPGDLVGWFGVSDRTAREWLQVWISQGLVEAVVSGAGHRIRRYRLTSPWRELVAHALDKDPDSGSESTGPRTPEPSGSGRAAR